jgi:hypothetical protein
MTLHLKSTTKAVTVEYIDGRHTSTWNLDASLTDDELADELRRIVSFYDAQTGREALPERTPGLALEMTKMTHPAPAAPANGWAVTAGVIPTAPAVPEGADYELIPPEEQS